MPWCPKCKNEYEEGVKLCADCGCELEADAQEKNVPVYFGTQEEMQLLKQFLEYSGLTNVALACDEQEAVYELRTRGQDKKQAVRLTEIFLQQKAIEEAGKAEEDRKKEPEAAPSYQNNAEKAEDNKSSAYTLLGVGGIGLLIMVLGMTGVLPLLQGTSRYMVYGVMSALFLLFIVMGAVSMKSSKVFARKAESENSLRSTMEKWCLENLDGQKLDEEAFGGKTEELTEEAKYFKRTELIKSKIQMQFMNLDTGFLERFSDEIYGDIFEA